MGIDNLQIIFDNPTAVFIPGEIITGRVLIIVSNSVKIKKVKLKFRGEGNVLWREHNLMTRRNSKNGSRRHSLTHNKTKTERYTAKEEYFNHKIILVGGEGKLLLKEGDHVYPFSVSLPDNLPSTFEEEYGRVQYTAKVVINIPWDIKKGKEIAFEVISTLHLNDEPSLAEPKILEREKFYCCCCCKSGPMTMIVYVPYTGFVPGQSIPVTVELDNNSNVDVDSIIIILERVLKFKARFPSSKIKCKALKIVNVCIDGVEKHTSKTRVEQIQIPSSLIIPNLKHCGIITDTYSLHVEACINGGYINEVISVNIILGDMPLTIATDARQFDYSFQPSNQSYFSSEHPTNPLPPVDVNETISVPGYAHLVVPSNQFYSAPHNNLENGTILGQNSSLHIKFSAYPDPPPPYQFSDPEIATDIQVPSISTLSV
ncbi:arrestin domain-containing protein 3-like [Metopolophium dirhodum]|uniref:arrestin domain-containing protein 3-like n=1 Tax=Metopolophium dirhodum TaxID=44670 RepID=UPI0029902D29|nr:arrestin domain-containing protein 3-like [Metopolophium dirhodum]